MSSSLLLATSPGALGSPRNASHGQLLRPTDGWTADIVSVVPKDLVQLLPTALAAVSQSRWHCIASAKPDDASSAAVLHVWYDPPNATLEDLKDRGHVVELTQKDKLSRKPVILLALETSSTNFANLYMVNAAMGDLIMWQLSSKDLAQNRITNPQPSAITRVQIDREQEERITSLDVGPPGPLSSMPMIVIGTSLGKLYWVKQTPSPISLNAQEVVPASSLTSGLITRLLTPAKKSRTESSYSSGISKVLFASTGQFFAMSQRSVVQWKVTVHAESSRADFYRVQVTNLEADLQEYLRKASQGAPPLTDVRIITAASSVNAATLHFSVLTRHSVVGSSSALDAFRVYWVVFREGKISVAKWLNRFADPQAVRVHGMLLAGDCVGYLAAVQRAARGSLALTIFMALDETTIENNDAVVHELDLPATKVDTLLTPISLDVVTHGCCTLTTNGLGLHVRRVAVKQENATPATAFTFNPATIQMLVNHLRASFWEAYANPSGMTNLPPSLRTEYPSDVEVAIVTFCRELQQLEASAAPQSLMECHTSLLGMLQQAGLYRTLSNKCRWNLFGIGQQVAVFQALLSHGRSRGTVSPLEQEFLPRMKSSTVAEWLVSVETHVFGAGVEENQQRQFLDWFCLALKEAGAYRDVQLLSLYDISQDTPPNAESSDEVPIWTSNRHLQELLTRQLTRWRANQGPRLVQDVETVVTFALRSFSDSYAACKQRETEVNYASMQQLAVSLLRPVKGITNDQLAWSLSREHCYFEGLCEIAYDHEQRPDRSEYSLEPLFRFFSGKSSAAKVGLPFCHFVLSWHCANDLLGHVLQYGSLHCPGALNTLLENDEKMRSFKWIHAVQSGDYDKAAEFLLSNAKSLNLKPSEAKIQLSIASIANLVRIRRVRCRGSRESPTFGYREDA